MPYGYQYLASVAFAIALIVLLAVFGNAGVKALAVLALCFAWAGSYFGEFAVHGTLRYVIAFACTVAAVLAVIFAMLSFAPA